MRHPIGLLALGGRETERLEGATLLRAIEGPRIQGSAMSPRQESCRMGWAITLGQFEEVPSFSCTIAAQRLSSGFHNGNALDENIQIRGRGCSRIGSVLHGRHDLGAC